MGSVNGQRIVGDKATNVEEALTGYRRALEVRTREAAPLDWASHSTKWALVYVAAEWWGRRPPTWSEALGCYRRALEVRTRHAAPLQWTATQNAMGVTLANDGR
eukprot:TRINITY_DN6646_c0_g1_i1.p3 TRINITY_DN6646_c0_g1~~TRINITY_DN6646_c0_g1_i1.p3  ORF type:complete len:104 (-),score=18.57 TRINITY_DN6646_c0_g1_i1:31-342(-)